MGFEGKPDHKAAAAAVVVPVVLVPGVVADVPIGGFAAAVAVAVAVADQFESVVEVIAVPIVFAILEFQRNDVFPFYLVIRSNENVFSPGSDLDGKVSEFLGGGRSGISNHNALERQGGCSCHNDAVFVFVFVLWLCYGWLAVLVGWLVGRQNSSQLNSIEFLEGKTTVNSLQQLR